MTNKEIRHTAVMHLRTHWDGVFVLSLYEWAILLGLGACDSLMLALCKLLDIEYYVSPKRFLETPMSRFALILRVLMIFFALLPELSHVRRLFIDILSGNDWYVTRRYLMYNSKRMHPRSVLNCFVPLMLKFFSALPMVIGIFGIYYFGFGDMTERLTTGALFCFMISLAFSVVWFGLLVHYCISLSLVKYIMALNPRANVFDACDLSVRLMEGNHLRYLRLQLSFAKYLPLMVFIYPVFFFVPFYRMSMAVLAKDIMSEYWQDKMPAMIKRWNKYAR